MGQRIFGLCGFFRWADLGENPLTKESNENRKQEVEKPRKGLDSLKLSTEIGYFSLFFVFFFLF